ncbi:hypothetical protein C5609_05315 [Pseudomonas putida]|nr:hypothetical protein C5609_05315 [Pseudomonas putida]
MNNVLTYPSCTFTPPPFTLARLAFWIGALLLGLVALAFAWLADAAFASLKRLPEWRKYRARSRLRRVCWPF